MDAFKRCVKLSKEIGIFGLVVDAKHERAKKFYFQYGFHELNAQSLTLFIPTKTIVAMMAPNYCPSGNTSKSEGLDSKMSVVWSPNLQIWTFCQRFRMDTN